MGPWQSTARWAALVVGAFALGWPAGAARAQDDPIEEPVDAEVEVVGGETITDEEPDRVPMTVVPTGCPQPDLPDVVFIGTLVDRDFRTARFHIDQVRAGDPAPFAIAGLIDVRYGHDVQFLEPDSTYLVSASRHPVIGILASRIREPAPNFGGDDIVGLAEPDLDCPELADWVRTLHPDGSEVTTSVLAPLFEQRGRLVGAVVVPLGVAFGVVFLLAMLRVGFDGVVRGVSTARSRRRA